MVNVSVIGRLGADAEIVNGKNGQFVSFRMATDDRVNNEKVTTWFRVAMFGDRFTKLLEYLTKGRLVMVSGRETVSTYQSTKDGTTQVSRDITADNIEFINTGSGSTTSDVAKTESVSTGTLKKPEAKPMASPLPPVEPSTEDDLPF